MLITTAANAWRERGYRDAKASRAQRLPLRDDDGKAAEAYLEGYRRGERDRDGKS